MEIENRIAGRDRLLTWGFAALVAVFSWAMNRTATVFPSPELWEDVAVAAGIRPVQDLFPLLWHALVAALVRWAGLAATLKILTVAGPVVLMLMTVLVIHLFFRALPGNLLAYLGPFRTGRVFVRLVVGVGAALFAFSAPVQASTCVFSPDSFRLFLFLSMIAASIRALKTFGTLAILFAGVLTAAVAAESILGFFSFFFFAYQFYLRRTMLAADNNAAFVPTAVSRFFGVRHFASSFLLSYAGFVALNVVFYQSHSCSAELPDGLSLAFLYFSRYLRAPIEAGSLMGGIVLLVLTFSGAFVLFLGRFKATDPEEVLPFGRIFVVLALGVPAMLQSFPCPAMRFDLWCRATGLVSTDWFLSICRLATALTGLLTVCILGVDVLFRNYRRLSRIAVLKLIREQPTMPRAIFHGRLSRGTFLFSLVGLMALAAAGNFRSPSVAAAELAGEAAELLASECAGVRYAFTDGSMDAALECLSRVNGGNVKALSMFSRQNAYARAVRLRDETDAETRALLAVGAAETLRDWVRAQHTCASNIAVQAGFELWTYDKRPMPPCGGLVARTVPLLPPARTAAVERAHALAERLLTLRSRTDLERALSPDLYSLLSHLQFRLARLCLMRAGEAYARGNPADAEAEHRLADRLNAANPEWERIQAVVDRYERDSSMRLTPREGLEVGFFLRDVRFARAYARQVIGFDPLDFKANYALGLGALAENDYARAERHLLVCLRKRPDDAVVRNNLAVVLLRLDRLAEAEEHAARAVKLLPDVPSFKKTLEDIRQAKKKEKK